DVPNFAGLESRLFGERWVAVDAPRHLYHFTEKTLRAMLEKNGLRVIDVIHGSDVSRYRMGYSESLRHLIMDVGLKKYPAKKTSADGGVEGGLNSIPMDSVSRKLENGLFGVISAAADVFHVGGRLSALAAPK
ncbi:MAG TPA: hypothetical protein PLQ76_09350, partial [bacterium]|nr:hypothetical protein [bacterium]